MGRNLPLKTRRRNAAGLNARQQRAFGTRRFLSLGMGRRAEKTFLTGNSSFRVFCEVGGVAGNSVTLAIVNGGTAPVITATGNAVTVTTPVATTTAHDVIRAINFATTPAFPLVVAQLKAQRAPGSDGTGLVSAVAATALAGGTAAG